MRPDPRDGVKPSACTNCGKVMDSASELRGVLLLANALVWTALWQLASAMAQWR